MFEFFQDHKLLTFIVIGMALLWIYFMYKNLSTGNSPFDQEYKKVMTSSKHKVKGKFE